MSDPVQETPDRYGAYPRLSAEQIDALASRGQRHTTDIGETLFHEGDPSYDFYVILSGAVALIEGYGTPAEREISVHGPGRFLGELSLLAGQPALLSAVVREPGEVLNIPVDDVRALVAHDPTLGDLILRSYMIRRSLLIEMGAGIRIIGSRYSADARRLRDFAARNRLPYRWIDVEQDPTAETLLRQLGVTPQETPVVIWRGQEVLRNPSNDELARVVGLAEPSIASSDYDVVVVGAGPAGLAAGVYAASEGLSVVVLDAVAAGGQASTSSRIENYLGFPGGISGGDLAERATLQARKFGARITVPASVTALDAHDGLHLIRLADGTEIATRTVLITTGARYRKLRVPRLAEFEGTSVYYAATAAEAQLCRGDQVAVVGGGNSAGQATVFLAGHVAHAHLMIMHDDLSRDMSRYLADRITALPNVTVHTNTEVCDLEGNGRLEEVVVADMKTEHSQRIPATALFVFIGAEPCTTWLDKQIAVDHHGYVLTGSDVPADAVTDLRQGTPRRPYLLETSRLGVFAAGDVRSGSIKRVASAVGEGAMAIRFVHEHLRLRQG
ncbi:FAD-dependent oxidoreductase [Catellatospora citrea]|uniref:Thioredoxin reductase n=1 Tax=Catellatospora citrea TaxID=53366 RepID=A0A8J3P055_9ACTN|nr:FAD-dependent oxidoreductase [Catellatospora citrea]RKE10507.1 thioredoxin reductase (NADPH) [Catellatospora citrea]GIF98982.1 thioredoxin reductase [Catellatospora citrea]